MNTLQTWSESSSPPAKRDTLPQYVVLYSDKISYQHSMRAQNLTMTSHFNSLTSVREYSQGWFLTILDVAFECPAPKVGHLQSP